MQFFTLVLSALAATSLAAPTHPEPTTTACGGAGCSWTTTTKPAVPTTTKAPGCGGQGCEWTSTTVHPSTTTTAGNGGGGGGYNPCANEGLYKVAQCCATDVLGLADLDCQNRESSPVLKPSEEQH